MLTYLMYFPWLPLEAGITRSTFCFSFKRGRKLSFLIYRLVLMRRSPKETTQHEALESTFFTLIEVKKLRFCLRVYFTVYSHHNQSTCFGYYLGNKFRLDISHRLSVKTLTTNRCEISPLTECRINTGNKYKKLMMTYVKPKLVA